MPISDHIRKHVAQLQGELNALYKLYPELRSQARAVKAGVVAAVASVQESPAKRRWTNAQRALQAKVMKARWAARKRQKG